MAVAGRALVWAIGAAAIAVSGAAPAAGCASNPAPPAWRIGVEQAQRTPFGAWASVTTRSGADVNGELLAVESQAIVVDASGAVRRIARTDVRQVRLGVHDSSKAGVVTWTVLGALSTVTHGFFLVLTAPLLWVGPGTVASAVHSRRGIESADGPDWDKILELRRFARFPAGLPAGFERAPRPPGLVAPPAAGPSRR